MSTQSQVWQVMSEGQVYETDLETLKEWVAEGRVLPTDKVSKGSLSWIEARRAPVLRALFHAPDGALPASVSAQAARLPSHTHTEASEPFGLVSAAPATAEAFVPGEAFVSGEAFVPGEAFVSGTATASASPVISTGPACYYHADASPKFICRICAALFCEQCPKFAGATKIPICTLCGDLCKPYEEVIEKSIQQFERQSGFGLKDFKTALGYPFQNIIGLIFMAVFYGLLLLGGLKGQLLAYMILFGTITLVINNVACGRLNRGFVPDFSDFSWWDDAIAPAFLGLGIWIVTIGPTIVLAVAVWYGWLSGPPPTGPTPAATQQQQSQFTEEDFDAIVKGDDPQKDAEAVKKLEQLRTAPIADLDPQYNKRQKESEWAAVNTFMRMLNIPAWVWVLGVLLILWAVFYYPMALAVAGYTEDFKSVINPLIGLDTMRRMGLVYVKAFLMYLVVQAVGLVLSVGVSIVTAPFDLPFFGNLPARFIEGVLAFYINLVIACILGLALYKCADRLDIQTD
jgi:hypothetical protein